MRFCGYCGTLNETDAKFCSGCGKIFEVNKDYQSASEDEARVKAEAEAKQAEYAAKQEEAASGAESQQPDKAGQKIPYAEGNVVGERKLPIKNLIFGIIGFYFGVNSIVFSCFGLTFLAFGVVGLVFSILSLKGSEFRLAKAGRICAIIGLALCVIMAAVDIVVLVQTIMNLGRVGYYYM